MRLVVAAAVVFVLLVVGGSQAVAQPAPHNEPRIYLAVGFGPGVLTGTSTERFSNAVAITATFGSRLTNCAHLVFGADMMTMARSSDPKRSLTATSIEGGIRWTATPTLHARAMVGLAVLERRLYGSLMDDDPDLDAGLVAGVDIAWLPLRARDYAAGLEVGDQFILDGGELRQSIAVTLVVQLSMAYSRRRTPPPPVTSSPPPVAATGSGPSQW